ncbi:hypothetical protein [uncultured Clostridium sp.]|jgi:hypothetical protein|uniref:hypothetical protein n=1 Tax=uncultured Clostridium sp. TaxID=59620 RepID=UPI0026732C7D|nr:hypothetical protein [uncultured Clostridium sp.]
MSNGGKISLISLSITILIISIFFIIPKSRKVLIKAFKEELVAMAMGTCAFILGGLILISPIIRDSLIQVTQEEKLNVIVNESEKEIASLKWKQGINGDIKGSFVLGMGGVSGNVGTESYFYFYTKENNRYKLEKINTDIVLIEETNEVNPKIVYREYNDMVVANQIPTKLGEKLGLKEDKFEVTTSDKKSETILYIPVGSIVENYNPNVE